MARKVFISSDMSSDEAISEVSEIDATAGLMWPWILTYFDDWGRAKASPREIKNSIFQANDLITLDIIKRALELYSVKLVKLYEVKGKPYMCIDPDKWFKYQTHIRREKRENDGSKLPPPDNNSAQVREDARDSAQISDNLTNCIPSPSPSPSLSFNQEEEKGIMTAMDAYYHSFKKNFYTGQIQGYISELMSRGFTDAFVREIFLVMGQVGANPDVNYMKKTAEDWIAKGIYTLAEFNKRRDEEKQKVVSFQSKQQPAAPKEYIPDPELMARVRAANGDV